MESLRALNRARILRSAHANTNHRGFVVHGRLMPGVAAVLKRYKLGGSSAAKLHTFSPGLGSGCRVLRSTTTLGAVAHKRICDTLTAGRAPDGTTTFADTCARGAHMFAARSGLRFEAAELVIAHPTLRLATRFDALFLDAAGHRELVSWKTGCGPRHTADVATHKAQLAMEWKMLEQGHGVQVHSAMLLYLGALQSIATRRMAPVYQGYALKRGEAERLCATIETKLKRRKRK
jgi:hypothetical protein